MSAVFSPCRTWRYTLTRYVAQQNLAVHTSLELPTASRSVAFVCLNPSTADEVANDPTVSKCVRYATRWGFDRFVMLNVFAFRSTDPRGLYETPDPIGPDNDDWIRREAEAADLVVAAWGNHGDLLGRGEHVLAMLRELGPVHALAVNRGGQPQHPLYLRGNLEPTLLA